MLCLLICRLWRKFARKLTAYQHPLKCPAYYTDLWSIAGKFFSPRKQVTVLLEDVIKWIVFFRHPDTKHRPTFSQLKFCLDHKDDRILGKSSENKLQRTRSVTFSSLDDDIHSIDTSLDDLQNTYCKTE